MPAGDIGASVTATILQGFVVMDPTGALQVNIGGNTPKVRWMSGWAPVVGDVVRVLNWNGELTVLGRINPAGAQPSTGTITSYAGGAATCTITAAGATYTCYFLSAYTPVVADIVRLDWSEGAPFVLGKRSVNVSAPTPPTPPAPPPPPPATPPPPPPPPPPETGVSTYPCIDSGYFSTAYGWSGGTSFGSRLAQGTSGGTNTGAWFYGSGPSELAGRTITRARIYVIRTNAYGTIAASPAHLYSHGSATRPGGNVSLLSGPNDASLPRGGEDWFDIDVTAGANVVAGGGMGISGTPYLVLEGVRERSNSGLLELTWSR